MLENSLKKCWSQFQRTECDVVRLLPTNCQKLKNIQFTIICDKEKPLILVFDKLESEYI